MKTERISIWQFALLIFISRSVLSLSEMPVLTSGNAERDGWISSLICTLIGIPVVLFYTKLAQRFPNQTIFEYSDRVLGPYFGRLATLPLLWGFLHYSAVILRSYGEVIVSAVLPQTPLVFVMGAMIFVCAVAVRLGLEVLARSSGILVPLFLVAAIGVTLFAAPHADFSRILPIGVQGLGPILKGAVVPSGFYFLFATILVIYPSVREKHQVTPAALLASTAAGILVTLSVIVALGVFGANDVTRLRFPFYSLARIIQISEFVERTETFTLAAWGVGLFIELAIIFFAGARGVALWMGVKDHRRLVFPMGAILLTLALTLFPNSFLLSDFMRPEVIAPYAFLAIFVGPGIIWIGALIKGTKHKAPSPTERNSPS